METVNVNLGAYSYPILIGRGILSELGSRLKKHPLARTIAVVTNPDIEALYGDIVRESLADSGFTPHFLVVPAGEETKSLKQAGELYDFFLEKKLERRSAVVALGGGVIGDLAGFMAATVLRGVPFVQVPTTLLAQVDSSVGGKVGINHPLGKNLIGAFYQPILVLADTETLRSLPEEEFRAGLAEVVKYGIIADKSFFEFLQSHVDDILNLDESALIKVIRRSCEIKAQVVSADEREGGLRAVLNYGHTIGHAIEALTGYGRYKHGEAVAWGMVYAALLSKETGLADTVSRQRNLLTRFGLLGAPIPKLNPEKVIHAMFHDKKVADSQLRFVLTEKIGNATIDHGVSIDIVEKILKINPLQVD
jgi:3-dehydroquinate synthase